MCAWTSSKISWKTLRRKSCFTKYREYVFNILFRFVWENTFSFLTHSRPLEFIFSVDFSISNWLATKTQILYSSNSTIFHCSVKYKFGNKHHSSCIRAPLQLHQVLVFTAKNCSFLEFPCICKEVKKRGKISLKFGENICWLFHVLGQFLFTISKAELDYYDTESECTSFLTSCQTKT